MAVANSFNNTLTGSLTVAFGGDSPGDLYFLNANGFLQRLAIGANGQYLSIATGFPQWVSGAIPSGNAGGDLTGTYPNPTIATNAVTFAKMQTISSQRLLGRSSAGSGTIEELTAGLARTLLELGTAALANTGLGNGNVPVLDASGQLNPSVLPALAITSIQVVADQATRLALTNVQQGDAVKQTDNGITYLLSTLPATTPANWVAIGDTSIDASEIVSGIISTARLGTGTANTTTYLRGDNTWQTIVTQFPWTDVVGTSQAMAPSNGYRPNNSSLTTLTLPVTAAIDSVIRVAGVGSGGWRVAQNTGQQIYFGDLATTSGNSGRLDSMNNRDCVELLCIAANTTWQVISSIGNIDVI